MPEGWGGWLVLLLIVVLVLVAMVMLAGRRNRGTEGGEEREDFAGAKYVGNAGRSTMYEGREGRRYKLFPLCCPECRAHAENELRILREAQKYDRVARLVRAWETREHPANNTEADYPYLALELEPAWPLTAVAGIDWPQFREAVETAERLGEEPYFRDAKAAVPPQKREVDTSFASLQMSRRGPILAQLDHPRAPKSTIIKCLAPRLFGRDAARYEEWAGAQVKK